MAKRLPMDFGEDVSKTVLISGAGRSGTTWLADFINFDGRYRDLFEPFHAWMIPEAKVLKGHWYQRPGHEPPPAFIEYVDRVLRGAVRHPWIDRFNERVISSQRIVKAIRADLFLGWVAERYPELKIVHLLRHPAAVAYSRLKLPAGWDWHPTLEEMLEQEDLRATLNEVQASFCQATNTPFQEHILTWCIFTRVVVADLSFKRALSVHYEDLLRAPEAELRRVLDYLGRPWDPRCLEVHGISSRTARGRGECAMVGTRGAAPWIARLSSEERDWLDNALGAFELGNLYLKDGYPTKAGFD